MDGRGAEVGVLVGDRTSLGLKSGDYFVIGTITAQDTAGGGGVEVGVEVGGAVEVGAWGIEALFADAVVVRDGVNTHRSGYAFLKGDRVSAPTKPVSRSAKK